MYSYAQLRDVIETPKFLPFQWEPLLQYTLFYINITKAAIIFLFYHIIMNTLYNPGNAMVIGKYISNIPYRYEDYNNDTLRYLYNRTSRRYTDAGDSKCISQTSLLKLLILLRHHPDHQTFFIYTILCIQFTLMMVIHRDQVEKTEHIQSRYVSTTLRDADGK